MPDYCETRELNCKIDVQVLWYKIPPPNKRPHADVDYCCKIATSSAFQRSLISFFHADAFKVHFRVLLDTGRNCQTGFVETKT